MALCEIFTLISVGRHVDIPWFTGPRRFGRRRPFVNQSATVWRELLFGLCQARESEFGRGDRAAGGYNGLGDGIKIIHLQVATKALAPLSFLGASAARLCNPPLMPISSLPSSAVLISQIID